MEEATLQAAFDAKGYRGEWAPSGLQLELALAFADLYESHGLITDGSITPPLWACCPNARECWRPAMDERPRDHPEDGGISLPWIGPDYRPGGVVVLAINFNDASGLITAFDIADSDKTELSQGSFKVYYDDPSYRGSDFPYCSTRSAAMLVDVLDGQPPCDREQPSDVAPFVDRLVRLQAIKCSPRNSKYSEPTPDMWLHCPPMLLADELAIARPGAIVTFGADVRWVLAQVTDFETREESRGLVRGAVTVAGRETPVYCLYHPGRGAWRKSQPLLKAALEERS